MCRARRRKRCDSSRRAGYANVGKTNLHEFAYGITSANPHFGTVPNPRWPGRTAGGSSGGSAAAVAAGLATVGLGSDSGGSIRIPAACCGLVGFKPTHGLVPLDGCFPLAPSYDTAGPIAATVEECAVAMAALVPGLTARPVALDDLTIGVAWLEGCDPLVRERLDDAARAFPNHRAVDFPLSDGSRRAAVFMREVADVHRELFAEHADLYGADVRLKIERCLAVTDDEYDAGLAAREAYRGRCAGALQGLDLLLVPTLAFVAPPADSTDLEIREAVLQFTLPFNALGWPALALPCGPAERGIQASLQLAGPPGSDALVLGAGAALESLLLASVAHTAAVDR